MTSHSSRRRGEMSEKSVCTLDMQKMTPKMCCLTLSGNTSTLVGGLMRRVLKMSIDTLPDWLMSFCTSGIMTCCLLCTEIFITVLFMATTVRMTPPCACTSLSSLKEEEPAAWLLSVRCISGAGTWVRSSKMVAAALLLAVRATLYQMWWLLVWPRMPRMCCTTLCMSPSTSVVSCKSLTSARYLGMLLSLTMLEMLAATSCR
mmetsp:Transcript_14217/g.35118  ORF Transcript_14217/g.35118 Transcript_14217/m.35118 type:complete len:203 (+) Transcript_14217:932-1540(+)